VCHVAVFVRQSKGSYSSIGIAALARFYVTNYGCYFLENFETIKLLILRILDRASS